MKLFKRFTLFVFVVFLLSLTQTAVAQWTSTTTSDYGPIDQAGQEDFSQKKISEWTIMLYGNRLGSKENTALFHQLLSRIAREVKGNEINVVVEKGLTNSQQARYTFKDGYKETENLGKKNSSSSETLWQFMEWAAKTYPAKRYFLIIDTWDNFGALMADRSALHPPHITTALQKFKKLNKGKALPLLYFYSCHAAQIEYLYELGNLVEYVIASPLSMRMLQPQVDLFTKKLLKNPDISTLDFANFVTKLGCDTDFCKEHKRSWARFGLLSVWNMSKIETLAKAVSKLAYELDMQQISTGKPLKIGGKFISFAVNEFDYSGLIHTTGCGYYDLRMFAQWLANGVKDFDTEEIRMAATDILKAHSLALEAKWHYGGHQKQGGLSITFPAIKFPERKSLYPEHRSTYKSLKFSADTHWDEFLDRTFRE